MGENNTSGLFLFSLLWLEGGSWIPFPIFLLGVLSYFSLICWSFIDILKEPWFVCIFSRHIRNGLATIHLRLKTLTRKDKYCWLITCPLQSWDWGRDGEDRAGALSCARWSQPAVICKWEKLNSPSPQHKGGKIVFVHKSSGRSDFRHSGTQRFTRGVFSLLGSAFWTGLASSGHS